MLTAEQKQLVEENLLLSRFVIKKYFRQGKGYPIEYEDMEQIGYLALCKAARNYDPDKGIRFSSYACRAIQLNICQCLRDISADKRQSNLLTVSLYQEYKNGKGSAATLAEILPDTGMSIEDYILLRQITKQINEECNKDQRTAVLIACLIGEITQTEAAQKIGVSQPQVSRLLTSYKHHLREAVGA